MKKLLAGVDLIKLVNTVVKVARTIAEIHDAIKQKRMERENRDAGVSDPEKVADGEQSS